MKMPPGGRATSSAKFDVGEEVNSTLASPTQSDAFTVLLPYPPSANRLVRHTRSGHYPSKPYMDWKLEADRYLLVQKVDGLTLPPEPWADEVNIETRLHPPDRRRRDLDNVGAKAILDRLTDWRIIVDDSQVQRIVMLWDCVNLSRGTALVIVEQSS